MIRKMISYPLQPGDPTWPGNPTIEYISNTSIENGDTANTGTIKLFNHYGSHIDGPMHFNPKGISLCEFSIDNFIFNSPCIIDIPKNPTDKITAEDLDIFKNEIKDSDIILIRTGFQQYRLSNPDLYESKGPAISSNCAKYMQENLPNLRAIALDFVSLASYSDTKDGDLAHQYMLGMYHDRSIFIIEDTDLANLPKQISKIYAIPLYIKNIDSSPVTMWAEI